MLLLIGENKKPKVSKKSSENNIKENLGFLKSIVLPPEKKSKKSNWEKPKTGFKHLPVVEQAPVVFHSLQSVSESNSFNENIDIEKHQRKDNPAIKLDLREDPGFIDSKQTRKEELEPLNGPSEPKALKDC